MVHVRRGLGNLPVHVHEACVRLDQVLPQHALGFGEVCGVGDLRPVDRTCDLPLGVPERQAQAEPPHQVAQFVGHLALGHARRAGLGMGPVGMKAEDVDVSADAGLEKRGQETAGPRETRLPESADAAADDLVPRVHRLESLRCLGDESAKCGRVGVRHPEFRNVGLVADLPDVDAPLQTLSAMSHALLKPRHRLGAVGNRNTFARRALYVAE